MTALCILGAIALILLLIGQIRIGGEAEYSETGVLVCIRIGPLRFTAYPAKKKTQSEPPKEKTAAPDGEKSLKEKVGGTLSLLRELLPLAAEAAGELKRKIRIDLLVLHLTWASKDDPAAAAMGYGAANAAIGMIYPIFDQNFKIKESDVGVALDYEAEQPLVYVKAILTLTISQGVSFVIRYGIKALSIWMKGRKRPADPQNVKKKEAVTHE